MRVLFYASDKPREQALAKHFLAGVKRHGHETEKRELCARPTVEGFDAVCMVGVKSKRLFEITRRAGAIPIMLDKGYVRTRRVGARTWEFWRVSVGEHHPTRTTLGRQKMPHDRFEALGLDIRPWRRRGYSVVFAGSSAKYHDFYGLPDPQTYAEKVLADLRERTARPLIYRPKPSWKDAKRIKPAQFSTGSETIADVLQGAWALVTHGSNASFEAALLGIPSIVLGDGVAAPVSSRSLDEIDDPLLSKREQWLANLAYHQWTEAEMRSGEAWATIGGHVDAIRAKQAAR